MLLSKPRLGAFFVTAVAMLLVQTGTVGAQRSEAQGQADLVQAALPSNHVPGHVYLVGGPITFKFVTTYRLPSTTSSTVFVPLPNAAAVAVLPPNSTGLINVRFHAESACDETGGAGEQNWCEVRILIGGVEGYPQASSFPADTFAFDSTDDGNDTLASWEAHAMERHRCVRNPQNTAVTVPVVVEWKVTNFAGDADVPNFWLDDFSLAVERSDGCQQAGQ